MDQLKGKHFAGVVSISRAVPRNTKIQL